MSSPPTKILNVNDFAPGRYAKTRVLQDAGYEVLEAESGYEAIETATREVPALILLDVHLPDIDGFAVCERLKSDPRTASTAILQISAAYVQQQHRVKGLELGADSYLVEPIENEVLLATVRALLRMREAERALRRATNEWAASFNAINDGIALVRSGCVTRCNEAFQRMFAAEPCEGKPVEALLSARGVEFTYPDRALLQKQERFSTEILMNGRWSSVSVDPLKGEDDQEGASVCVIRDVHLHRVAEEQREKLLESERRARAFAEAARHQSEFLAEASRILGSGESERATAEDLAALAVDTFADWCFIDLREDQKPLRTIVAAREGDTATAETLHQAIVQAANQRDALTRVLTTGEPEIHPDSMSPSPIATQSTDLSALGATSSICVPVVARGVVFGAITVARTVDRDPFGSHDLHLMQDVAQRVAFAVENRRLFREAQKANHAKDEFLATLSHELRTPLTSALGWAKMLKIGGLDEGTVRTALDTIERSTEIQSQIIEDILDISRIVTGKLNVKMRRTHVAASITAAVDSLRLTATEKNVEIRTIIDPSVPPVIGDHARLQQIVWNLISNAIKFTPDGGAPIEVRLTSDERDAILTVEDRGEGIPPDFLPFVFDRFRQADGATTREHGGLGLGLAIVRHLVEVHGGTVTAHSDGKSRGSKFVARIPLAPVAAEQASAALDAAKVMEDLDGMRVLLLDPAGDPGDVIVSTLSGAGATVRVSLSVSDAIANVRAWAPHVLISEVVTHDLAEALQKSRNGGAALPLIALSGYARAEDRERARQSGFASYLQKPIDPAVLTTEIVRVVAEVSARVDDATTRG